ncbi:hypothetical protein TNIN_296391 [Trichonephila inaurata madagascariensis]|uniref:Uncharacterized protein n=1 Tax=Trichonephila inaurata madagascariensis TaxID=2747483 RepID=A0A8X7CN89_9ARAC|nr:hypothetical protein TNIN_296391 [Trichonephila inaurata madagascariensis]
MIVKGTLTCIKKRIETTNNSKLWPISTSPPSCFFPNQNTSQNIRRQGFWNFRIVSSVRIYIAEERVQDSRVPEDPPSYRQKPSTLKFSPKSTIPSRGAYHNNNLTDLRAGVPNGHPEEDDSELQMKASKKQQSSEVGSIAKRHMKVRGFACAWDPGWSLPY